MTITSSYSSRLEISRTSSGVRLSFLRPSSITLAAMEVTLLEAGHSLIAKDGDASITRSEEHTSELQSLMRISYAVFCLKKKKNKTTKHNKYQADQMQLTQT